MKYLTTELGSVQLLPFVFVKQACRTMVLMMKHVTTKLGPFVFVSEAYGMMVLMRTWCLVANTIHLFNCKSVQY